MRTPAEMLETQRAFRYANERFGERIGLAAIAGDRIVPYLCECSDLGCLGRVEMTSDAYVAAHTDRNQFVVVHSHASGNGEEVVEEHKGYDIVRRSQD